MENRTKIILASTAVVLILATAAGVSKARDSYRHGYMGQDRHGMAEKMFDRFDTDGNGAISKTEVDSVRKSEMSKHDSNEDGKLSLGEFEALWVGYMRDRMVDHFQRLDSDGDAQVTDEEISKPLNRIMSWLDRNDDNALTRDEMHRKGRHMGGMKHRYGRDDDDDDRRKD